MEYNINVPVYEDLKKLVVGDVVYLNGIIATARDEAHLELLHHGNFPKEFVNGAVYHAGPIVREDGNRYTVIALGPTTSARMNSMEKEFVEKSGVKIIVGKGGMSAELHRYFSEKGVVYLAATGGAGLVLASTINRVVTKYLGELGMAEAVWILDVKRFGPLIVGSDLHGSNLYSAHDAEVERNFANIIRSL